MIFSSLSKKKIKSREEIKIDIYRSAFTVRKNFRQTRLMNSSQILTRAALAVSSEVRALESASEE